MKIVQRALSIAMVMATVGLLSGCAETELVSHFAKKMPWSGADNKSAGAYKVGNPYRVGSVWYYPEENFRLVETGIASWYGPDFHGKRTANGEIYNQNALTAAHRTLQMPSLVRVTNLENGKSVVVRINDRGPFKHGRVIDLSSHAADVIGMKGRGTARVKVEVMETESRKLAAAARSGQDTSKISIASLRNTAYPEPVLLTQPKPQRGVQVASLSDDIPESLQTPTITVEELSSPGRPDNHVQPPQFTSRTASKPVDLEQTPLAAPSQTTQQRVDAPAVATSSVAPTPMAKTGLYVQAGSFSVAGNAERLRENLKSIAPVQVDPVMVNGRTFYRVKLGPIATVQEADRVLERVIQAGNETARVVRPQ